MVCHIHRSSSLPTLIDRLADIIISDPSNDVFASEHILIASKGVRRWVTQYLSRRFGTTYAQTDGICAGINFTSPKSALDTLLTPHIDRWRPEYLTWTILELFDTTPHNALWNPIVHCHSQDWDQRRYHVARYVAELFTHYIDSRPYMLDQWEVGKITTGFHLDLPDQFHWQPSLWKATCERHSIRYGLETPGCYQRKQMEYFATHFETLPQRVFVVGDPQLEYRYWQLLKFLTSYCHIHFLLPHASHAFWEKVKTQDHREKHCSRYEDRILEEPHHRLWQVLGRGYRELIDTLPESVSDRFLPADTLPANNLLGWLQNDLIADCVSPDRHHRMMNKTDRSIQIHSCYGPVRQVDVLRDTLLDLFEAHPDLQPRDVIIYCPNLDTYSPLLRAQFGFMPDNTDPARQLRLSADRTDEPNAIYRFVCQLLDLVDSRWNIHEVLELLRLPPVRARFHLDDDEVFQDVSEWIKNSQIRWGINQDHQATYGLSAGDGHNSWRYGLDRMIASIVTSADTRYRLGNSYPIGGIGTTDLETLGDLTEFFDRLSCLTKQLGGPQPLSEWISLLIEAIEQLTKISHDRQYDEQILRQQFTTLIEHARTDPMLSLGDIREILHRRLITPPRGVQYGAGYMILSTLGALRAVPHRVVCLLGFDDIHSESIPSSDDIINYDPHIGENNDSDHLRGFILDMINATQEYLLIIYSSHDLRTGHSIPAPALLTLVRDTLNITAIPPVGYRTVSEAITVNHPLHVIHSPTIKPQQRISRVESPGINQELVEHTTPIRRDDSVGESCDDSPRKTMTIFHHDSTLFSPSQERSPILTTSQAVKESKSHTDTQTHCDNVLLSDLIRFFQDPAYGLLSINDYALLDRYDIDIPAITPVAVDRLTSSRLITDLIEGYYRRVPLSDLINISLMSGTLPPGPLGREFWVDYLPRLREFFTLIAQEGKRSSYLSGQLQDKEQRSWNDLWDSIPALAHHHDSLAIDLPLPNGRRLIGNVPHVYNRAFTQPRLVKTQPKHHMMCWITLLAVATQYPTTDHEPPWQGVMIGLNPKPEKYFCLCTRYTAPAHSDVILQWFVDMYDRGGKNPLPLPINIGRRWANLRYRCKDDQVTREFELPNQNRFLTEYERSSQRSSSIRLWEGDAFLTGNRTPEWEYVWGHGITLDDLIRQVPDDDERIPRSWIQAGVKDETSRLGALAVQMWYPLFNAHNRIRRQQWKDLPPPVPLSSR